MIQHFNIILFLLSSSVLHFSFSKVYYHAKVTQIQLEYVDSEIVDMAKVWMNRVSRKVSLACAEMILKRKFESLPVEVEMFRLQGATRIPLPFNISGDACKFIASRYLIVPDLLAAGLPDCPLEGHLEIHNFFIRHKNLPSILVTGEMVLRFSYFLPENRKHKWMSLAFVGKITSSSSLPDEAEIEKLIAANKVVPP